MARFFGEVGYGESVETPPGSGVWVDVITEFDYQGDILRNAKDSESATSVIPTLKVSNSISVVADQHALEHFFNIKYVRWAGRLWDVTSVEVLNPRLVLNLGGVYHGPTP